MEKLINREQLAGMNIHYLFYSLEYFLDAQKEADELLDSTKERITPIAHISAMVTICLVDHTLVFFWGIFCDELEGMQFSFTLQHGKLIY